MPTPLEIVEAEALKLSASERALLAEHLLASLDQDNEIDAAWAAEVASRPISRASAARMAASMAAASAACPCKLRWRKRARHSSEHCPASRCSRRIAGCGDILCQSGQPATRSGLAQ